MGKPKKKMRPNSDESVVKKDKPIATKNKTKSEGKRRKKSSTAYTRVKKSAKNSADKKSTAESVAQSTTRTSSKKESVVVSIESPVGKRKRKANKSQSEGQFTQSEKQAFYECLVAKGFNCIHNERLLMRVFPNRSVNEIKALIDSYTRKGQELNKRSEETTDSEPNSNKQPIEKWFDLIHQLVPNSSKKDDISAILVDLFDDLRAEQLAELEQRSEDSSELTPNYNNIYECIGEALKGRYAPKLEPIDAFVVVKLIEELKHLLKYEEFEAQKDFFSSGHWWTKTDQLSNEDYFNAIYLQRQHQMANLWNKLMETEANTSEQIGETEVQNPRSSDRINTSNNSIVENGANVGTDGQSTQVNDSANSLANNLLNFPKTRKIAECFNPLRVAIHLIEDQYYRWQSMSSGS